MHDSRLPVQHSTASRRIKGALEVVHELPLNLWVVTQPQERLQAIVPPVDGEKQAEGLALVEVECVAKGLRVVVARRGFPSTCRRSRSRVSGSRGARCRCRASPAG